MASTHEETYRRTIESFVEGVERGHFTEAAVPRHIEQLRQELGQCMELELIGQEFYSEGMERLQLLFSNVIET